MNRPDRPVSWRRNPAGTQISGLILLVVLTVCAPYAAYGTGMYEEDGSGLFDDGPSILPDLLFPGLSGTGSDAQNGLDPSSGTLPNPLLSTELLELLKNALEDSSRNGDVGTPAPGPNGTVTGPVSPASPNQPVAPAVGAGTGESAENDRSRRSCKVRIGPFGFRGNTRLRIGNGLIRFPVCPARLRSGFVIGGRSLTDRRLFVDDRSDRRVPGASYPHRRRSHGLAGGRRLDLPRRDFREKRHRVQKTRPRNREGRFLVLRERTRQL